jgi:hypothetical protein
LVGLSCRSFPLGRIHVALSRYSLRKVSPLEIFLSKPPFALFPLSIRMANPTTHLRHTATSSLFFFSPASSGSASSKVAFFLGVCFVFFALSSCFSLSFFCLAALVFGLFFFIEALIDSRSTAKPACSFSSSDLFLLLFSPADSSSTYLGFLLFCPSLLLAP